MEPECILLCVAGFKLNEKGRVHVSTVHHIKGLCNLLVITSDIRNLDVWFLCNIKAVCMCMANCPMLNPVRNLSEALASSGTPQHGTVVTPGDSHLSLFDINLPWLC